MRCLRQALRACVSTDWWKRVLVLAPRFKKGPQSTGPRTGSMYVGQPSLEFSAEMTCDAVVERVMELMQPLPTGYLLFCLLYCGQIDNYQFSCLWRQSSVFVDCSLSNKSGSPLSSLLAERSDGFGELLTPYAFVSELAQVVILSSLLQAAQIQRLPKQAVGRSG